MRGTSWIGIISLPTRPKAWNYPSFIQLWRLPQKIVASFGVWWPVGGYTLLRYTLYRGWTDKHLPSYLYIYHSKDPVMNHSWNVISVLKVALLNVALTWANWTQQLDHVTCYLDVFFQWKPLLPGRTLATCGELLRVFPRHPKSSSHTWGSVFGSPKSLRRYLGFKYLLNWWMSRGWYVATTLLWSSFGFTTSSKWCIRG